MSESDFPVSPQLIIVSFANVSVYISELVYVIFILSRQINSVFIIVCVYPIC